MNLLSERIETLAESATIAMSRKSRELREQGHDVISLSLGEPDFHVPQFIKEAAIQAIRDDYSHYPPIPGYKDLREAISHKFQRDNGLRYHPEQIVVSTGAKQSIANVVLCTIDPGDEVLLPAPYWVTYQEIVKLAGGIPRIIETSIDNDFKVTRKQLENHCTGRTKLLIFSSPCNPSGSVFTEDDLEEIASFLRDHPQVLALSDEIYEHIQFGSQHASLASRPNVYDQVVTINGLSKGFAMTGYRLGYIGAPPWLAEACTKMQGQFTSAASSISQRAALAALKAHPRELQEMQQAFRKRRDLVIEALEAIPGIKTNHPQGAFYVFPDISALLGRSVGERYLESSNDLCLYLLEEAQVALVPGEAFGSPDCVRISYASSEDTLKEALQRIKNAVENIAP
ncbi:MAG: pyridoxal phosphate-dependent aminotransferase [Schleiferiaceae bacterium]|nr:pyridoxal phosphate-dependent aminotransferase [Schleiferiaceae bacterium]MDR9442828.1 pyridoxal phosphate-dependent aminotransferase [Schleiferiaceae bacterium]